MYRILIIEKCQKRYLSARSNKANRVRINVNFNSCEAYVVKFKAKLKVFEYYTFYDSKTEYEEDKQANLIMLRKQLVSRALESMMGNSTSELYAYMVAERMDINAIPYRVAKWKGNLCSVCELFTNKHFSYVPVGRLIKSGGMKAVRQFYESLGQQFVGALDEMIVFDAVICNTDRHYGNFGVLVDSDTNKIVAPAPLFDHGNSLFNLAGEENWKSEKVLQNYVQTLFPCVYDDFISEAKAVMNDEIKEKLRKLLTFDIKKTGKYNYSSKKLKIMNEIIKTRVSILLQN